MEPSWAISVFVAIPSWLMIVVLSLTGEAYAVQAARLHSPGFTFWEAWQRRNRKNPTAFTEEGWEKARVSATYYRWVLTFAAVFVVCVLSCIALKKLGL
jgi:hypothetical protein